MLLNLIQVKHLSKRLCSVPWLRPAAEATPLPIACNPLLPKDQFSRSCFEWRLEQQIILNNDMFQVPGVPGEEKACNRFG